jgi:ADP-ribose pyrophosphatase
LATKKFETLHSETTFQGKVFSVRHDKVRLPNAQITTLDIIAHPPAVVIVPVDDEDKIWFVSQYRHAVERVILELPAGVMEPGEKPELCAIRELREEIGMSANRIQKIGEFFIAPGYSSEYLHIFLAMDLKPDPLPGDEDEFISIERIQTEIAFSMIEDGKLLDSKSLASLLLAQSHLGR